MQNITKKYDVLIVGAGPAGSNAAISYKDCLLYTSPSPRD